MSWQYIYILHHMWKHKESHAYKWVTMIIVIPRVFLLSTYTRSPFLSKAFTGCNSHCFISSHTFEPELNMCLKMLMLWYWSLTQAILSTYRNCCICCGHINMKHLLCCGRTNIFVHVLTPLSYYLDTIWYNVSFTICKVHAIFMFWNWVF